jgi:galacturonosyltransferase
MINAKRIAVITNHADDIFCFRKELIESFLDKGYEVLISCPYGEKLKLLEGFHYIFADTEIDRRGQSIINDLKLIMQYYRILKKHKPDIVLTYTIKPNVYASLVCSLLKIPYINNVTGLGSVITFRGFVKKIVFMLLKKAFRNSACVFFQNESNVELALSLNIISRNYKLIPGSGVNIERFSVAPFPEDSEKIIFNYIGRVLKEKGINDYIEAAKVIRKKYPSTEFNVIGFIEPTESHYADELKELEQRNILVYRGNQNDVRPFINRSHCTIHPSKYGEGMSNVLLESASTGRPLITTDIPGCRETVIDGVSGYIYRAGDINDLVEKIEAFLSLDNEVRKKMGLAGRNKVETEFSRKFVVDSYLREIADIFDY